MHLRKPGLPGLITGLMHLLENKKATKLFTNFFALYEFLIQWAIIAIGNIGMHLIN
jgi:hypothetical protein